VDRTTDQSASKVYDAQRCVIGWPGWIIKTVALRGDGGHDVALTRNGKIVVVEMMFGKELSRREIN
jgi:hypothetical protein